MTLWQFEKEVKAFEDTLPTRTSASSGGGGLLGALCVADDDISIGSITWLYVFSTHPWLFIPD